MPPAPARRARGSAAASAGLSRVRPLRPGDRVPSWPVPTSEGCTTSCTGRGADVSAGGRGTLAPDDECGRPPATRSEPVTLLHRWVRQQRRDHCSYPCMRAATSAVTRYRMWREQITRASEAQERARSAGRRRVPSGCATSGSCAARRTLVPPRSTQRTGRVPSRGGCSGGRSPVSRSANSSRRRLSWSLLGSAITD